MLCHITQVSRVEKKAQKQFKGCLQYTRCRHHNSLNPNEKQIEMWWDIWW